MKNYLFIIPTVLLIFSCGSESIDTGSMDETLIVGDQLFVDSLEEDSISEEMTFEFFEDYAAIESKTKLYEMFDDDQLKEDTTWYAEGEVMRLSTTLKHNDREIKFVWEEDNNEKLSNLDANMFLWNKDYSQTSTQTIPSRCGISLGATLKELVEWNDAPVHFAGFGWDYSGSIFQGKEENEKLVNCETGIRLEIEYVESTSENFDFIYGDVELNSEMEGILDAPIYVGYFSYYLPSEQ